MTLAGRPDDVARAVIRLARGGIRQFLMVPVPAHGTAETLIERFQTEVMPLVRAAGM